MIIISYCGAIFHLFPHSQFCRVIALYFCLFDDEIADENSLIQSPWIPNKTGIQGFLCYFMPSTGAVLCVDKEPSLYYKGELLRP